MTDKEEVFELLKVAKESHVTDDIEWVCQLVRLRVEENGEENITPEDIIKFGVECFRIGYFCGLGAEDA